MKVVYVKPRTTTLNITYQDQKCLSMSNTPESSVLQILNNLDEDFLKEKGLSRDDISFYDQDNKPLIHSTEIDLVSCSMLKPY